MEKRSFSSPLLNIFLGALFLLPLFTGCFSSDDDKKTATPTPTDTDPTELYLFRESDTDRDGNLGGRSGADTLCRASSNIPSSVTTVYAFLSTGASDTIAVMPTTYSFPSNIPIYGPDGSSKIADNWADLIDGTIDMNLETAGVLGTSTNWYSGSDTDGTLHTYYCNGWASNSGADGGRTGRSDVTDGTWISNGSGTCDFGNKILCIGHK